MNTLIASSFLKIFFVLMFIACCIFLYLFIENIATKILSKNYYRPYEINPLKTWFKLLTKETLNPFKNILPALYLLFVLIPFSVLPICDSYQFAGIPQSSKIFESTHDILFFFAFSFMSILIIAWHIRYSHNNLTILSSIRAINRKISCTIPLLITTFSMLLFYKNSDFQQISLFQDKNGLGLLMQPLAGIIFFITLLAEIGTMPFNTAENSLELNGGYLSEHAGTQALFMQLARIINFILFIVVFIYLFFGGFNPFWGLEKISQNYPALIFAIQGLSLTLKVIFIISISIFLKLILPTFTQNYLLFLANKRLLPFSFINLLIVIFSQFFKTAFF